MLADIRQQGIYNTRNMKYVWGFFSIYLMCLPYMWYKLDNQSYKKSGYDYLLQAIVMFGIII